MYLEDGNTKNENNQKQIKFMKLKLQNSFYGGY
jgi:hypothetical protein